MKSYAWLAAVALVLASGCTKPNPRDCADGLCTDPAYPFCDIDGALAGEAKTCIAVSCTPSEFETCRGDMSIVCNAVGNDYDLVQCEKGCDPTRGCRACTSAADCGNPTPICDADESACRVCELDDECPSTVCDDGACLNEAGILYVLPNGSDTSDCSRTQPCTMLRANVLATTVAVPPITRLLPAVYPEGIDVTGPSNTARRYVASGATIASEIAVRVQDGGNVEVRGLAASGTTVGVDCVSTTSTRSKLVLRNVVVTAGGGASSLMHMENCDLSMFGGELDIGSSTGSTVFMRSNVTFKADRIRAHGSTSPQIGTALSERLWVSITNSVLENVQFQWATSDSGGPGSFVGMAFNTMVLGNGQLNCKTNSGSAYRTSRYENNIVVSSQPSAVDGTDCMLSNNVLFPFTGTLGTNIALDPQFEDPAAKDYRLNATSPAVDAAVPSANYPATIDYAGVSRPQGAGADIGAIEYRP